jgi:hypothetical protein
MPFRTSRLALRPPVPTPNQIPLTGYADE